MSDTKVLEGPIGAVVGFAVMKGLYIGSLTINAYLVNLRQCPERSILGASAAAKGVTIEFRILCERKSMARG